MLSSSISLEALHRHQKVAQCGTPAGGKARVLTAIQLSQDRAEAQGTRRRQTKPALNMCPFRPDAPQRGRACAGGGEPLLQHAHELKQPFKVRALGSKQTMQPLLPLAAAQPDLISSVLAVANQRLGYELKRMVSGRHQPDPLIMQGVLRYWQQPGLPLGAKRERRTADDVPADEHPEKQSRAYRMPFCAIERQRVEQRATHKRKGLVDQFGVREHCRRARITRKRGLDSCQ